MPDPPTPPTPPSPPMITFIYPDNWIETFLNIFRNDTKYGFENRQNPEDNVFKRYSVVQSLPDNLSQIPALYVRVDAEAPEGESNNAPAAFLDQFVAMVNVFIVALKNTKVQYNGKVFSVPSEHSPIPDNNLFDLLINYVGLKLKDNPIISDTNLKIQPRGWFGTEYFRGYQGIPDARAVRIGLELEVELDG